MRGVAFERAGRVIFEDLTLEVPRGRISAIMGPSGIGKTTLLKIIGGQLRPLRGTVLFDGRDVHALRQGELYELRKRMGMLFQSGALLTDINVFDNVAFPLREHTDLPETLVRDLVLMKLEAVGLRGARNLMPAELSGGMARRVALARAIALDPEMIMYDEPFTGLDPITKGTVVTLIKQLNDALGLTSVMVSHDVAETVAIADYIYLIADGRVMASGTTKDLAEQDLAEKESASGNSAWVRQFMEGLPDGPVPFHYPAVDYADDLLTDESA